MRGNKKSLFRKTSLLIAGFICILGTIFIIITYLSIVHYFQTTTQRLNKDVALHIAKFTSPFESVGLNKKIADSIFYNAMVLSPSVEVYFLDTTGHVVYYHAPDSAIKIHKIPLFPIRKFIESGGEVYITGPDPKVPGIRKVFSAAEVSGHDKKLGYIYVILGGSDFQTVSGTVFENHVVRLALQAFIVIIILSIALSILYLTRIKRNLRKLTNILEDYSNGNYSGRMQKAVYNEFTPLTESFNRMAELLTFNISRLQQSEQERKDFLANISHDLRTPLTVVRGYVEAMQEESMSSRPDIEKQIFTITIILKKLEILEQMIMQLFELSKMESVGFRLSREPFNLTELIDEMITDYSIAARKKNILIRSVGLKEMAWINADIALMERCIQNLLENSIKHTSENGSISIHLLRLKNGEIMVIFKNTSPPLPADLIHWINNGKLPENSSYLKKGLGLAIIKKVSQLHEYEFCADNEPGTVSFALSMMPYKN